MFALQIRRTSYRGDKNVKPSIVLQDGVVDGLLNEGILTEVLRQGIRSMELDVDCRGLSMNLASSLLCVFDA